MLALMKDTTFICLMTMLIGLIANSESWGSVDLGVQGTVYDITEPDLLEILLKKAAKAKNENVFEKKLAEKEKIIKSYLKRPDGVVLPFVKEDSHRFFDPTYTLKDDIPDGKGGILYPAGFKFNPLTYMTWNKRLCFINSDREEELSWAKKSCSNMLNDKIILLNGCYTCVQEQFKHPVFFDQNQVMMKHFGILKTPTRVSQFQKMLLIQEFKVER